MLTLNDYTINKDVIFCMNNYTFLRKGNKFEINSMKNVHQTTKT